MKKPDSYFCDACGVAKGETNHWRIIVMTSDELILTLWNKANLEKYPAAKHSCGSMCTQKLVERWVSPLATGGAA